MRWSTACEFAIRATTYLAERPDAVVQLKDIAAAERLPAPFVAKILLSLVKAGVLRSVKGPGGGYGLGPCTSAVPCALHESFAPIRKSIRQYVSGCRIWSRSKCHAVRPLYRFAD